MNGSDMPKGAGLFLLYRDLAVFGVKHIDVGPGHGSVRLTGIGGKVEPRETFRQCAVRECLEETGAVPRIAVSKKVWMIRRDDDEVTCSCSEVPLDEGPFAVVFKPPVPGYDHDLEIRVFVGELEDAPRPVEKLRHLLLVPPHLLRKICDGRTTLRSLGERGVEIMSEDRDGMPSEYTVSFMDSPEVYVRHMKACDLESVRRLIR